MTESDREFREAFDAVSEHARAIANHVVAGVPVPTPLLDRYVQAQGRLDRALDALPVALDPIR